MTQIDDDNKKSDQKRLPVILKKKIAVDEGITKNYHVDYTGKMIYFDNQK